MRILLIVPAFNEENNLPVVLERLEPYRGIYDVVIIDDASTDGTRAIAQCSELPVVSLPANLGIGGAVQTGFKYAVANGYDVTVQFDGDGQHDPAQVVNILDPIRKGIADCVIGSRYIENVHKPGEYRASLIRRAGMVLFAKVLSVLVGKRITDTTSGFRALNSRATEYFSREYPVDFPDSEALLLLHRGGYRIVEVPVTMCPRISGASSTNAFKAFIYPFRMFIGLFVGLLRNKG